MNLWFPKTVEMPQILRCHNRLSKNVSSQIIYHRLSKMTPIFLSIGFGRCYHDETKC